MSPEGLDMQEEVYGDYSKPNPTPSLETILDNIYFVAERADDQHNKDLADALNQARTDIKAWAEYEKQKAVEGILTKVEDWAHSNSDMGGDMPYGELLEYLTELKNTPSDTKGDIDEN